MSDNVYPFRRRAEVADDLLTRHDWMCISGLAYNEGQVDVVDDERCNCDYVRSIRRDERTVIASRMKDPIGWFGQTFHVVTPAGDRIEVLRLEDALRLVGAPEPRAEQ